MRLIDAEAAARRLPPVKRLALPEEEAVRPARPPKARTRRPTNAPRKNPVFEIPGFTEPTFLWKYLDGRLAKAGHRDRMTFANFPGIFNIEAYARKAKTQLEAFMARTHATKVDIVSHSMGNLVAAYMMGHLGMGEHVDHWASLSAPFKGTQLANLIPGAIHLFPRWFSGRQMAPDSNFLRTIHRDGIRPRNVKMTTIHGSLDEIVLPHSSSTLRGVPDHVVPGAFHDSVLIDPRVADLVVQHLDS